MRFLIVHDRVGVANQISESLTAIAPKSSTIDIAEDYISARMYLENNMYDLAIIDLTIPHVKGRSEVSFSTADNLIQEIFTSATINVPGDLIGITREPEAFEMLQGKLRASLMAIIKEDNNESWRTVLEERTRYVVRSSSSRYSVAAQRHDYDAVIVCAHDKELEPYRSKYEMFEVPGRSGAVAHEFVFADSKKVTRRAIACAIGRSGQASAASVTQSLITQYRPVVCLMSGICGAVRGKMEIGDVIFFETIFDWDSGKWLIDAETHESRFHPRPDPISIRETKMHLIARRIARGGVHNQEQLQNKMRNLSSGKIASLKIRLGPAASGSAVLADPTVITKIQEMNEDLKAVDMESYGFYYAARHTHVAKPDFVCVKAAADYCDSMKNDSFQPLCCEVTAEIVQEILSRHWSF